MLDRNEAHEEMPEGATFDGLAVISVPVSEWETLKEQVAFMHKFITGFIEFVSKMGEHPMLRVMVRQFGINPDELATHFGEKPDSDGN